MRYGPEQFQAEFSVSRETMERLAAYDALLLAENERHNLIANSTVETRWDRHFRDSAQLYSMIPEGARTVADLGSGAGFPGLVLAALGAEKGLEVFLLESIGKKAAFLGNAAAVMRLQNVVVIPQRIESTTISPPDVITARALARLVKLLGYAAEIANEKTLIIAPKGQDVGEELTEAAKSWHMTVERRPSVTNPQSQILAISGLRARPGAKSGRGAEKRRS